MATALAKGTALKLGNGSMSETFTQIANMTDLKWDGVSWDQQSTTSHDSSEPVKTGQPTVYSNGNFTFSITYDPSNTEHAALRSYSTSPDPHNFQIEYTNGVEEKGFVGFIMDFGWDVPVDGLVVANVTVMVNGAFTVVS